MYVALAIIGLGVLVVVHEAGHYFVARWSNMRVERFSIGFGPAILKWRSGETQFQLAPIPFGGFVQITGMNPHEEFDEKDPRVYPNRPAVLRFLTILAGPGMNYVFSIVLIFAVYLGAGVDTGTAWWRVKSVAAGQPADGKLLPGDRVLRLNGQPVFARIDGAEQDFSSEVQKTKDAPILVTVLRNGQEVDVEVKPLWIKASGEDKAEKDAYRVGVVLEYEHERVHEGVGAAAAGAAVYPITKTQEILGGLYKVVKREVPAEVTGPVGIVDAMEEQIEYGWVRALEVLAMLNVYLGLFNLLPIPGLDGGRLAFLSYELATRRRPNPKVEATVHMFGFLLLFLLIILVTFKDIKRLF